MTNMSVAFPASPSPSPPPHRRRPGRGAGPASTPAGLDVITELLRCGGRDTSLSRVASGSPLRLPHFSWLSDGWVSRDEPQTSYYPIHLTPHACLRSPLPVTMLWNGCRQHGPTT